MDNQKMELEGPANTIVLTVGDQQTVVCLPQQRSITQQEALEAWELLQAAKRYQDQLLNMPRSAVG